MVFSRSMNVRYLAVRFGVPGILPCTTYRSSEISRREKTNSVGECSADRTPYINRANLFYEDIPFYNIYRRHETIMPSKLLIDEGSYCVGLASASYFSIFGIFFYFCAFFFEFLDIFSANVSRALEPLQVNCLSLKESKRLDQLRGGNEGEKVEEFGRDRRKGGRLVEDCAGRIELGDYEAKERGQNEQIPAQNERKVVEHSELQIPDYMGQTGGGVIDLYQEKDKDSTNPQGTGKIPRIEYSFSKMDSNGSFSRMMYKEMAVWKEKSAQNNLGGAKRLDAQNSDDLGPKSIPVISVVSGEPNCVNFASQNFDVHMLMAMEKLGKNSEKNAENNSKKNTEKMPKNGQKSPSNSEKFTNILSPPTQPSPLLNLSNAIQQTHLSLDAAYYEALKRGVRGSNLLFPPFVAGLQKGAVISTLFLTPQGVVVSRLGDMGCYIGKVCEGEDFCGEEMPGFCDPPVFDENNGGKTCSEIPPPLKKNPPPRITEKWFKMRQVPRMTGESEKSTKDLLGGKFFGGKCFEIFEFLGFWGFFGGRQSEIEFSEERKILPSSGQEAPAEKCRSILFPVNGETHSTGNLSEVSRIRRENPQWVYSQDSGKIICQIVDTQTGMHRARTPLTRALGFFTMKKPFLKELNFRAKDIAAPLFDLSVRGSMDNVPCVSFQPYSPNLDWLIIGSRKFWEMVTPDEVGQVLFSFQSQNCKMRNEGQTPASLLLDSAIQADQRLWKAFKSSEEDISVLVIRFIND